MTKNKLLLIAILLVGILFLGKEFWWPSNIAKAPVSEEELTETDGQTKKMPESQDQPNSESTPPSENIPGLTISYPKLDQKVSSPLKITGTVNGENWIAFEGQAGAVKLIDNNQTTIASGILETTSEWTKLPASFEANLTFNNFSGPATLVFQNENPSGDPQKNAQYSLPVTIPAANTPQPTTNVKLFFNDKNNVCEKVVAQTREIPKTNSPAKAALEQLLLGPTAEEKSQGIVSSINPNVKIQSLVIENSLAKVDFSPELNEEVSGSCRVSAIRAQITQTLKQFSTIKGVIISVNGEIDTVLQP